MGETYRTLHHPAMSLKDKSYADDQTQRVVAQWLNTLSPSARDRISKNDQAALATVIAQRLQDAANGKA